MVSMDMAGVADSAGTVPSGLRSRYQFRRELRCDKGVRTWVATDLRTGADVIVKLAPSAGRSPEDQRRILFETAVSAATAHPALVPIIDAGEQDESVFVVVPLVLGETLAARLARGPLDVDETLSVGRSVLYGLDALHGHGFWHLNLRPQRILVPNPGSGVCLLPAGIERTVPVEQLRHGPPTDSLHYAAPEQIGLIPRPVDARSDLYSVGILLYACLAGEPPFVGTSVTDLLASRAVSNVPPLRVRDPRIPRSVDELVRRLLHRDPDDRYHSAAGAVADVEAVLDGLSRGTADPRVVLGRHDRRRTITEPSLVGRAAVLARLAGHLECVADGRGGLVLVEGESGVGKSRVLHELAEHASRARVALFEVAHLEPGTRQPLEAFSQVVSNVVDQVGRDQRKAEDLLRRLGDEATTVQTILPELCEVIGSRPGEAAGLQEHGWGRSVSALARFLEALGGEELPAVVLLDDCQWADDLTLDALAEWQGTRSDCSHVLVVAAFRSDEVHATSPLRLIEPLDRLVVENLDAEQVVALAESAAGPLPTAALELVERWSRGNPFMVTAAVRGLVEAGALLATDVGWKLDETSIGSVRVDRDSVALLTGRLGRMSTAATAVLHVGALIGSRFGLGSVTRITGLGLSEATEAVVEAERAQVLVRPGDSDVYAFVHDRLREAVLAEIDDGEARVLHRAIAIDFEQHDAHRSVELAYHFDAAGEGAAAFRYALPAARDAAKRYALDLAEALYRIADRAADDPGDVGAIAGELGVVLKLRGRYQEATLFIERARHLATSNERAAWAEAELGDLAVKQGNTRSARRHLKAAIVLRGARLPRGRFRPALLLLWEAIVQSGHLMGTQRLVRLFLPRRSVADASLVHLYDRLLYPLFFDQSTLLFAWTLLHQLNLAERAREPLALARAYASFGAGTAAAFPVLSKLALDRVDRSLQIRTRLGDEWGRGQSLSYRGTVLYAAGRLHESEDSLREAEQVLQRMGDQWEVNVSRWNQALCRYRVGDLATAVEICKKTVEDAIEIGDLEAIGASVDVWAKATGGDLPGDVLEFATDTRGGDAQTRVSLLQALAISRLRTGATDSAVDALEEARRVIARSGVPNVYAASVFPWMATARRAASESFPRGDERQARRLLRSAKRSAAIAIGVGFAFRQELPHALREAGLVSALEGKHRRSRWLLDRSVASARHRDARHEEALTVEARARVGHALGWEGAESDHSTAQEMFATLRGPTGRGHDQALSAVALVQRYDALLDAGRRITSASNEDELCGSLRDAGVSLLRAEACAVLSIEGHDDRSARRASALPLDHPSEVERSAIARAIDEDRVVILSEEQRPDVVADGRPLLARSVLYAPIVAGGEPVACLRAVHDSVTDFFGDEERQLAGYLTSLATAAFERMVLQGEIMDRVIAAQEDERARVSRDLHGEIGSGLSTLLEGLGELDRPSGLRPATKRQTEELRSLIRNLLTQVQRIAFDLRPAVLDEHGLGAALQRLVDEVGARHCLDVRLEASAMEAIGRLDSKLESTIYRVVQEALTNVVRHSGATHCQVEFSAKTDRLHVLVTDDGVGFDAGSVGPRSLGMRGMKERAMLVGGRARATSTPDVGTTVVLEVPLD